MKDYVKAMKAVSDPNRVKIIKMLQHKVMCVCEMQEALKYYYYSFPALKKEI